MSSIWDSAVFVTITTLHGKKRVKIENMRLFSWVPDSDF